MPADRTDLEDDHDDERDLRVHTQIGIIPFQRKPSAPHGLPSLFSSPVILPTLPDSEASADDLATLDDELGDLVTDALQSPEVLVVLMCSEQHMVAVLRRGQRIEDDRDVLSAKYDRLHERHVQARHHLGAAVTEIRSLREQLAAVTADRDAHQRLYEAERDALAEMARRADVLAARHAKEAEYALKLLEKNERLRKDAANTARIAHELARQNEARTATDRLNDQVRSAVATTVPPEDAGAFEDDPPARAMMFARGSNAENRVIDIDTLVIDLPAPGVVQ